ncbi:MAG: hypothetical protein QXP20_07400 [Candidatus Bathyarchaeia archaeon]
MESERLLWMRKEAMEALKLIKEKYEAHLITDEEYEAERKRFEEELERVEEIIQQRVKSDKNLAKAERLRFYEDHAVAHFLENLLDGSLKEIIPSYDLREGYRYLTVEKLLGATSREVLDKLEHFFNLGFLNRRFFDKLIYCPRCRASNVLFRYICPHCRSNNLTKGPVIEHFICGHVDFEEKFSKEDKLICPKCLKELRQIGVDHRRTSVAFSCRDCKEIFGAPLPMHVCQSCGNIFTVEDAIWEDIYAYSLNEAMKSEIEENIQTLTEIKHFLELAGLHIMSPAHLRGVSGVIHEVDIASSPNHELREKLIVIEVRTADIVVDSQEIMNFAAKIFDLKPSSAVFIAIPKLDEEAAKLANSYGIIVIEAIDIAEAVKRLEELKHYIIKQ